MNYPATEPHNPLGRLTMAVVLTPQFPFPGTHPFGDIPISIHRRGPSIWITRGLNLCITGMGISL